MSRSTCRARTPRRRPSTTPTPLVHSVRAAFKNAGFAQGNRGLEVKIYENSSCSTLREQQPTDPNSPLVLHRAHPVQRIEERIGHEISGQHCCRATNRSEAALLTSFASTPTSAPSPAPGRFISRDPRAQGLVDRLVNDGGSDSCRPSGGSASETGHRPERMRWQCDNRVHEVLFHDRGVSNKATESTARLSFDHFCDAAPKARSRAQRWRRSWVHASEWCILLSGSSRYSSRARYETPSKSAGASGPSSGSMHKGCRVPPGSSTPTRYAVATAGQPSSRTTLDTSLSSPRRKLRWNPPHELIDRVPHPAILHRSVIHRR